MLLIAVAGCGGSDGPSATANPGELVELKSLDTLEAAFAEDEGKPRVLLLLSPT